MIRHALLSGVAAACAVASFAGAGPADALTVGAATAVTCPAVAAPITAEQASAAWATAIPRLVDIAGTGPARGFPFGRTGSGAMHRTSAYAWTSGFAASALWLAYAHTRDRALLRAARAYTSALLPVARWTGTHDLGFMVGGPTALGMRLDPNRSRRAAYDAARRTAARSLSTRWNGRIGAVRSGTYGGQWGLIVDSAMNAPLLVEAGEAIGGAQGDRLQARGVRHLRTLARQFVRADGSTFHRKAFDPSTGADRGAIPGQGQSTTSTWARGQAWAIAGFGHGYALTGDALLLDAARRTADLWIARVPAGCVPAWDLDVTDAGAPRDSSAAAVTVTGLLEFATVDPDPSRGSAYRAYALTTLATVAAPPFLDPVDRPGVLQGQSYNVPADAREGSYAWGDAYLLTALAAADL